MEEKKNKKKKKDAQLLIRLDTKTRNEFVSACDELDTTASRELRRFIKGFLARYESGELGQD